MMPCQIYKKIPEKIDKSVHYIFYLHGLIIEELGIRPKSEAFGYYEYEEILRALARQGFVVISEARKKGTHVVKYAEFLVSQIQSLISGGISPRKITVVGASKGGVIAAYVSRILMVNDMNFVFLAGLFEQVLKDESMRLFGNVLSIHDSSDTFSITPQAYFDRSRNLNRSKTVVLDLNRGHGLIYKPFEEWLTLLFEWIETD